MMITVDIDFVTETTDPAAEVEAWRAEFASQVEARIVGKGPTVVTLTASSSRALHDALLAYCGGDAEQALDHLRDARTID